MDSLSFYLAYILLGLVFRRVRYVALRYALFFLGFGSDRFLAAVAVFSESAWNGYTPQDRNFL
jgi:hypothetical protein